MSQSEPSQRPRLVAPEEPGTQDTKARLLDAAERLFAEHGFEGTSLRAVTQLAGASVSAANYHFGSKQALLLATLMRRLEPLNAERLARIDALEARAGDDAPALEDILEAFVRPPFDALHEGEGPAVSIRAVAARLYADPHPEVAAIKAQLFGPVGERFLAALQRCFPEQPREELVLSLQFVIGLVIHAISGQWHVIALTESTTRDFSDAEILDRIVAFAAAGLRAAASSTTRPSGAH